MPRLLSEKNLVLIGMMGSGKSTCARILAQELDHTLVDLDTLIIQRTGCPISSIFAQRGEAFFRQLEADAVREQAQRTNLVIATGGGTVLRPENVRALRATGFVVWLDRPSEEIFRDESLRDRPLAQNGPAAFQALALARRPLYQQAAHAVVRDFSSPQATVQAILHRWQDFLER